MPISGILGSQANGRPWKYPAGLSPTEETHTLTCPIHRGWPDLFLSSPKERIPCMSTMERFLTNHTNQALRNIFKLVFSRRLIYFCISRLACYYLFCHINCLPNEAAYCIIFQECAFICSCSVSAPAALITTLPLLLASPPPPQHWMHAVHLYTVAWLLVRWLHSQKWGQIQSRSDESLFN